MDKGQCFAAVRIVCITDETADVHVLPDGRMFRTSVKNLKQCDEKKAMKYFSTIVEANDLTMKVVGFPNGVRNSMIKTQFPDGSSMGLVICSGITPMDAYKVTMKILTEMSTMEVDISKEAFYIRRGQLLSMGSDLLGVEA